MTLPHNQMSPLTYYPVFSIVLYNKLADAETLHISITMTMCPITHQQSCLTIEIIKRLAIL